MRTFTTAVCLILGLGALAAPELAHSKSIAIENERGEKVKVCTYRSDDKSLLRLRKCWMLKKRETIVWNRGGDDSRFDLRVFEAGLFELPICIKRGIGSVLRVKLSPAKTKDCAIAVQRTTVAARQRKIDDKVLVNRAGDDFWYPAVILGRNGLQYWLRFSDGRTAVEPAQYISDEDIGKGRHIECNWKGQGRWYVGRVTARNRNSLGINFDAGWQEKCDLSNIRLWMIGALK